MTKILMASSFCYLFMILILGTAQAEETRVSLNQAVVMALKNNDALIASENSLNAQRSEIGISRSYLLPQLNIEENFIRTDNPTTVFSKKLDQGQFSQSDFEISALNDPEPINNFQTNFSAEMPVLGVQEYLTLRSSKKEYLSKAQEFAREKEMVAFSVIESYINVQTAKEFVSVAEKALGDAREHLRIANRRYDSGLGLYSDTLRASTEVTRAEQQIISTLKNLNVEKRMLGLLLGLDTSVDTDTTKVEIPLHSEDYYRNNSVHRNDIRSLEIKHENAKTKLRITESGYLPKFGVSGNYQLDDSEIPFGSEGNSWFIGGFMKWEIFNGGRREYLRAKEKYREAETGQLLIGLKKKVALKVYESYLAVDEARKKMEYSQAGLKTAEEGARLVKKRYENSLSPLVDLLDAQLILDQSRANLVANNNQFLFSIARLSFVSGTILKDIGIEKE